MFDNLKPLYDAQAVKQLDVLALEDNTTAYQLMCRAGQAAFDLLQTLWPQAKRIIVLCGYGNNAGDGLVLARLAKAQKYDVQVYQIGKLDESKLSEEAKKARQDWLALGTIEPLNNQTLSADVLVDALLGSGVRLPLSKEFNEAIDLANQSGIPIFALDLPSGIDANTGYADKSIQATATITFIGRKIGLSTHLALDAVGTLQYDNLGVSPKIYNRVTPRAYQFEYEDIREFIPKRNKTAYKGSFGHTLIIGGGEMGYSGAPILAGESALRSGSGLVTVAFAPESTSLMARGPQEMMCHRIENTDQLAPLLEKATVIVMGPGLTQNKWAANLYKNVIKIDKPMVIDADGLNLLAKNPQSKSSWILTPHAGEAARLLGVQTQDIQKDRISAAKRLQAQYKGVIVLKGAGTIVASETHLFVCPLGVPTLATGGTGDILAGMIGGLLAQHIEPVNAALIAVGVQMQAGLMERELGSRGMIASDLFLHIRSLLNPHEEL